ncbi:MAG: hypothetical protein IJO67_03075 [Clostridia bacterium]|nr:hypothetical protein [Clostridia bacterium]
MKRRNSKLVWFCKVAMMAALMIALHAFNMAMIPTGWGAQLTFDCLIVVVATMAIDMKAGLIMSLLFGSISAYMGITTGSQDPIVFAPILNASPFLIILVAVLPRLCIPLVMTGVQKLVQKTGLNKHVQRILTAVSGSLTNTVLFLTLAFIIRSLVGIPAEQMPVVLAWVGSSALINGGSEAVMTAIAAPPVVAALEKVK